MCPVSGAQLTDGIPQRAAPQVCAWRPTQPAALVGCLRGCACLLRPCVNTWICTSSPATTELCILCTGRQITSSEWYQFSQSAILKANTLGGSGSPTITITLNLERQENTGQENERLDVNLLRYPDQQYTQSQGLSATIVSSRVSELEPRFRSTPPTWQA